MPAPSPAPRPRRAPALARRLAALARALPALALVGCLKIPVEGSETPEPTAAEEAPPQEVWPGKGAGELYAVGELRGFVLRRGDGILGHSWGRYDGPTDDQPPLHRFTTRVELVLPGREPLRSAGEIVVDARGMLIRGYEQSGPSRLEFRREGDALVISDGRQEERVAAGPEVATMAFATIFHEELMLGLRHLQSGEIAWRLVSLSGSLPIEWSAQVEPFEGAGATKARLTTSLGETITIERGRIVAIDIADEGLAIRPSSEPWPTWELAPPPKLDYAPAADATFTRREVELPGRPGEPRLAGEVLIPAAARGGPRPAVLFIGGNGRQDRYGFAGPPPVDLGFHAISDALAEAGFVVLRFDERGQGGSEVAPLSWELGLEDARRALRTLLVQPEVDPDRLAIVGHGESGWRALQLAGEDRGVVAVALLAAPGRPYREILDAQAEADIAAMPPELQARAREEHVKLMKAIEGGKELPPELAEQAAWARELLAVDPARLVSRAPAALWIAQGTSDFEVDPERDPAALQALARRSSKKPTIRRYPGLDHLFKPETGESSPGRYLDPEGPRAVDPAFLHDLAAWLERALAPKRGGKRGRGAAP
ncbi:MAG: hypothetical protein H6711_13230 [Myxococcales bacterium]|nr:hypothetical protein [Myxococcales bacterium]